MPTKNKVYWLAAFLFLAGVALFLFKAFWLGFPITPEDRAMVWNVEAKVSFQAQGGAVKAVFFIPESTERLAIMDESFVSRGYGLNTVEKKHDRQAVWSIRQAKGTQTLYYRVVVMPIRAEATPVKSEKGQISPHGFSGAQLNAAQSVLASVKARSADQETLVLELIKRLNNPQPGNNLLLLLSRKPTQVKKFYWPHRF